MEHNEYRAPDGRVVRLINDDVLVKMDPPRERSSGGIVIPDTVGDRGDAGILTTGTILAYGFVKLGGKNGLPPIRMPIPEMSVGLKVVFIRYYAEQHSNQQIQYRLEEGVIRMKPLDFMLAFDPEDADRVLR